MFVCVHSKRTPAAASAAACAFAVEPNFSSVLSASVSFVVLFGGSSFFLKRRRRRKKLPLSNMSKLLGSSVQYAPACCQSVCSQYARVCVVETKQSFCG